MIRIESLQKRFKKLVALRDVTATFSPGQVISLIGPNGSGKTTLIKCILGMVKPDSGHIYFDNLSIHRQYQYRSRIGYMPQIGRYPDNMRIGQVIEMIKNIRQGRLGETDDFLYQAFAIDQIRNKTMQSLSGGTRQKISATLAFMFNPDVLILDEPTAGLDPLASEILKSKIIAEKKRGKLILITSHILSDLDDLTSDVMYIQDGEVKCFDTLTNIKQYTGEVYLSKAIARLMERGFKKEPGRAALFPHDSKIPL